MYNKANQLLCVDVCIQRYLSISVAVGCCFNKLCS